MQVEIVLEDNAQRPRKIHQGDAGFDLVSASVLRLEPLSRGVVGTGVRLAMPEGLCALVLPRSGLALKHGVTVMNSPGLIDSGYRGEVKVVLYNSDKDNAFVVEEGDRIAQLLFVGYPETYLVLVESLGESERGEGGFGHSGTKETFSIGR